MAREHAIDRAEGSFDDGTFQTDLARRVALPNGAVRVPERVPPGIPDMVRAALVDCAIEPEPGSPAMDPASGEPGMTPAERVYGWSSVTVLGIDAGDPAAPGNMILPRAVAGLSWDLGEGRSAPRLVAAAPGSPGP